MSKKVKALRIDCTFCEEDVPHKEHSNSSPKAAHEFKLRTKKVEDRGCYKCLEPECGKITTFKWELKEHFIREHTIHKKFKCNLCDFKGRQNSCVTNHQVKKHIGEEAKVFGIGCPLCEDNIDHRNHTFPITSKQQLEFGQCFPCKNGIEHSEHTFTTVNNPPKPEGKLVKNRQKHECSVCGKEFGRGRERVKHYQLEHPYDKIFNCQECRYGTNYLPNLNTHTNSMHKKKVRQCPHCSYNSTWNTSFLEHMRSAHGLFQKKSKHSIHGEGQALLCDDCGFSTFNQKQFQSHKLAACQVTNVVRGGNRFQRFTPATRKRDTIGMTLGNFKCNKCSFSSDLPADIRDHVQKVHGELLGTKQPSVMPLASNEDIKFKCNKCPFQTLEPSLLREHMSFHN